MVRAAIAYSRFDQMVLPESVVHGTITHMRYTGLAISPDGVPDFVDDGKEQFVDMVPFYAQSNVFYLSEEARWATLIKHSKQDDIALKIDTALHTIEKTNKSLAGALPDNYFSRLGLESSKLAALLDTINNIDTLANECQMSEEDLVGRVYEYFFGKFSASEGKGGGEFYIMPSTLIKSKCRLRLVA